MRNFCCLAVILFALTIRSALAVDNTWDYAVLVSAGVRASPPQITLSWPQDTAAVPDSYTVYRKSLSATSWGAGTVLAGAVTRFTGNKGAGGGGDGHQRF